MKSFKLFLHCIERNKSPKRVWKFDQTNTDVIKVETIFINLGNSETSDLDRLMVNLGDKITLKRSNKHVALCSNLSI